jgi:uncharacterized membrane protein YhaH (DUF805 family)
MIVSNALKTALYQLFVPAGRTNRQTFWIWLAIFAVLTVAFDWGLGQHDPSTGFYFWGFLIWMIMLICGIFGIYGKRLKDFGRSVGWIILAFTALFMILIVVMLTFGGAEYFAEYSQYQRKATIDPSVREQLDTAFQDRLSGSKWVTKLSTGALMVGFTLWVGLTPGDAGDNRYGPAPKG